MKEVAYKGILFRLYTSDNDVVNGEPKWVAVDAKRINTKDNFKEIGSRLLEDEDN